jgi:MarR family transcriptional regulator, organic hydroperoxide resistance regulator
MSSASAIAKDPAAQTSPGELNPPLGFLRLLWQIHHGLQSASKRMERDLGVTGPQRLVVRLLGSSPGMTAGELSELLHLDPGTMSGVVQRLLRERLIRRAADPHDRRRFLLALTSQGRSLSSRREGTVEERVETALATLEPEARACAEVALSKLAVALLEA